MNARYLLTAWLTAWLVGLGASSALAQLGAPVAPPENPITEEKRILGKVLFWEEQLSSSNTVACGTCHIPADGGSDPRLGPGSVHPGLDPVLGNADDRFGSPGLARVDGSGDYQPDVFFAFEPQVTARRANSPHEAAFFAELFWDGRAPGTFTDPETGEVSIPAGGALESQAVVPILSTVEMAHEGRTWDDVRDRLNAARPLALAWDLPADLTAALAAEPSYGDLFEAAFGDPAITAERIAYALATYERTLVPDQTPWDDFAGGDVGALTPQQLQGRTAFNSIARCGQCHVGALLSDGTYRNIGSRPVADDAGREAVTNDPADRGRFKVPSLRNVALRGRWFHNGDPSLETLADVVAFYDGGGGPFDENKDPVLEGLVLDPQVQANITAFLDALTDPRVAAELPPFDRPRLDSERAPSVAVSGPGVAGTGGHVPQLITHTPASLGNTDFKIGIRAGLGGARAYVRWSAVWPGGAPGLPGGISPQPFPRHLVTLAGQGPGRGYATFHAPLGSDPALIGTQYTLQWIVLDPAAPRRLAKSPVAMLTVF